MRRFKVLLLVLASLAGIWSLGIKTAYAEGPKLNAEGAILIEAESGQVLFEQDANKPWYPASITKTMTLALALEAVEKGKVKLSDIVQASENACSYGGSQVWLDPRDQFTLDQMLIAIAVGSANDASVAVAEHIAGTEENFVRQMNAKAKELGCTNTNFVNAHGLHDDNHYTSPADMAKIARYALSFPKILEYTSIKHYKFREAPKELILDNTNKLLWRYPGTDGLKTGTTSQAKRNLVSTVQRDNLRLIAVVMGADQKGGHFAESIKLYNWAFSQFGYKQFFGKGQVAAHTKVSKGVVGEIPLIAARKVGALMNKDQESKIETKAIIPDYIPAPVKKGQKVGEIQILQDGKIINKVDLLAKDSVAKATYWQLLKRTWRKVFSF
ncbi:D-alanyl-D-alanine carboxypeptidase family protein [Zhaonella formicivorans]|jgi:D-alanyl-D-alanine carboxypeptidase (penicillin-binding protein 5/6)|uniref:D-alanyl-D-alanine carboxypeptidase family protein n=1 Tax=Zhaonella formicivorans TaxID=2528593 RepID=UPI0010F30E5E|nr:D-alanyl-D-alanine carboxypeptidase family protein [Zhaonella formicivorans]